MRSTSLRGSSRKNRLPSATTPLLAALATADTTGAATDEPTLMYSA